MTVVRVVRLGSASHGGLYRSDNPPMPSVFSTFFCLIQGLTAGWLYRLFGFERKQ